MLFLHWNTLNLFFKNCLFFFCILFLHDDGCLLLFYPDDPKVYWNFFAYFQQNNFRIFYKWIICILVLKLAQPSNPTKIITPFHYLPNNPVFHSRKVFLKMLFVVSNSSIQTMVSRLMFFMCSFFLANGIIRLLISFTFWILPSLVSFRVDVSSHDILFDDIDHNNISLGPDGVPWHGPKKKGVGLMSSLLRFVVLLVIWLLMSLQGHVVFMYYFGSNACWILCFYVLGIWMFSYAPKESFTSFLQIILLGTNISTKVRWSSFA